LAARPTVGITFLTDIVPASLLGGANKVNSLSVASEPIILESVVVLDIVAAFGIAVTAFCTATIE